ncbi:MAG: hypothetical protein ACTSWP_12545 [Candidatus Freyarchaeota archaeon]
MPAAKERGLAGASPPAVKKVLLYFRFEARPGFTSVVVLMTEDELDYDLDRWRRFGVKEVFHSPVETGILHLSTSFTGSSVILNSPRVLVHYVGRIGRSGVVAAS